MVRVEHPERGSYATVGNPLKLSDSPTHITPSPLLGQHTEEILIGELGLGDEELRLLRTSGVI
ncbi:formyl-coenzyme A transferase [Streptomyces turgidiscabies]|nr:formyl-coenzyme A transferase [Streptomyces turgidiscabies]